VGISGGEEPEAREQDSGLGDPSEFARGRGRAGRHRSAVGTLVTVGGVPYETLATRAGSLPFAVGE